MALNYDNVSALTANKFMPILVDNIFDSNILTHMLLRKADKVTGGNKIIVPLEYGKGIAGTYSGWDLLSTDPAEVFTAAEYEWKQAYANISISGLEEIQNSGDSAIISLLKSKMKNAERTLKDLFGDKLFANAAPSSKDFTGLIGTGTASGDPLTDPGAIANTVISIDRSLGGIDSTTQTWWDANLKTFASGADAETWTELVTPITTGAQPYILKKMAELYGACSIDSDHPDLIVTTQIIYDAYEASLQPQKRFTDDKLASAGFDNLKYHNAVVVVDSHVPAGIMVMLNTKYLEFKVHPKRNFKFEPFRKPTNQDAMMAKILWAGNLTCSNPRMQGMLSNGPSTYA